VETEIDELKNKVDDLEYQIETIDGKIQTIHAEIQVNVTKKKTIMNTMNEVEDLETKANSLSLALVKPKIVLVFSCLERMFA